MGNGWRLQGHPRIRQRLLRIDQDGNLLWYSYTGDRQATRRARVGWRPNSPATRSAAAPAQGMQQVFGGVSRRRRLRPHRLRGLPTGRRPGWYRYTGDGEHDPTGASGGIPDRAIASARTGEMGGPPSALWTVRVGQSHGHHRGSVARPRRRAALAAADRHPALGGRGRRSRRQHRAFGRAAVLLLRRYGRAPARAAQADLVAWTDDVRSSRHGGHQRFGLTFTPEPRSAARDRGDGPGRLALLLEVQRPVLCAARERGRDRCPAGRSTRPAGVDRVPPPEPRAPAGVRGDGAGRLALLRELSRPVLRPGGKCGREGVPRRGCASPRGGRSSFRARSAGARAKTGQGDWRFCVNCHGLFFDGFPGKGVCPGALGGGIRLHAVLGADGNLDPFRAAEPLGVTGSIETPTGV